MDILLYIMLAIALATCAVSFIFIKKEKACTRPVGNLHIMQDEDGTYISAEFNINPAILSDGQKVTFICKKHY